MESLEFLEDLVDFVFILIELLNKLTVFLTELLQLAFEGVVLPHHCFKVALDDFALLDELVVGCFPAVGLVNFQAQQIVESFKIPQFLLLGACLSQLSPHRFAFCLQAIQLSIFFPELIEFNLHNLVQPLNFSLKLCHFELQVLKPEYFLVFLLELSLELLADFLDAMVRFVVGLIELVLQNVVMLL